MVGYVRRGRLRIVAGAPVCAPDRLLDAAQAFEREAAGSGERVCYFAAESRLEAALARSGGHSRVILGGQPVWDPRRWPEIPAAHASLRGQLNRSRNKGVSVMEWDPERATEHPQLRRILGEWLSGRGLPPLHFLVEPETLGRLWDRRVFVAERGGRPIGFLVASPIPARNGWLVEQLVRGADAPNGTTELMIDRAMRTLASDGAEHVSLGLAPLSSHEGVSMAQNPFWLRLLGRFLRGHARRFYDFGGLDAFKAKLDPHGWEPVYALSSETRFTPATLYGVAGAFGGGSPLMLGMRAILRAARQEGRRYAERSSIRP